MASIFKQRYTAKGEDGKGIQKKSVFWYVDYKSADGTRKRVKGFKDKAATSQLAAKLEKEAELAEVGIVDKYKEHRRRPLPGQRISQTQNLQSAQIDLRINRIFMPEWVTKWVSRHVIATR